MDEHSGSTGWGVEWGVGWGVEWGVVLGVVLGVVFGVASVFDAALRSSDPTGNCDSRNISIYLSRFKRKPMLESMASRPAL